MDCIMLFVVAFLFLFVELIALFSYYMCCAPREAKSCSVVNPVDESDSLDKESNEQQNSKKEHVPTPVPLHFIDVFCGCLEAGIFVCLGYITLISVPDNNFYFLNQIYINTLKGPLMLIMIITLVVTTVSFGFHFVVRTPGKRRTFWTVVQILRFLGIVICLPILLMPITSNQKLIGSLENGAIQDSFNMTTAEKEQLQSSLKNPMPTPFSMTKYLMTPSLDGGYGKTPLAYTNVVFKRMNSSKPPMDIMDHPFPLCQTTDQGVMDIPWVQDWTFNISMRSDLKPKDGEECTTNCAPVIMYFPGGNFYSGDAKIWTTDAKYFIERGYAFISVPLIQICNGYDVDEMGEFCADAVQWVIDNGRKYGLDPERIITTGTSSGAAVADLAGLKLGVTKVNGVYLASGGPFGGQYKTSRGSTPVQYLVGNNRTSFGCPAWNNTYQLETWWPTRGWGLPYCSKPDDPPFSRWGPTRFCDKTIYDLCKGPNAILPEADGGASIDKISRWKLNSLLPDSPAILFTTGNSDVYGGGEPVKANCVFAKNWGIPCKVLVFEHMDHILDGGTLTPGGQISTYALERFMVASHQYAAKVRAAKAAAR